MADVVTQLPTDEQAHEFAVMLHSGLPAEHAIGYFVNADTPEEVSAWSRRWAGCKAVGKATTVLMKGRWQDKSPREKMDYALEVHYNQLSTTLLVHNYLVASSAEKAKMDDARKSIEAKLAGTAGQVGALEMFYSDLRAGKVKLNQDRVKVSH